MNPTLVLLGVVIVVILYMAYTFFSGSKTLSKNLNLTTQQPDISGADISNPKSRKYSYELWLYVYSMDGNTNDGKYIFSRDATTSTSGGGGNNTNIGLKVGSNGKPTLSLVYTGTTTTAIVNKTVVITDNLPIQTWVHVIISVDNSYIDTYINGKLVKSIKDDTIESPAGETIGIKYGIINAYLAKFTRHTSPTDPQTAWNNYTIGNGENPFSKFLGSYGMAISLKKDGNEYTNVSIF